MLLMIYVGIMDGVNRGSLIFVQLIILASPSSLRMSFESPRMNLRKFKVKICVVYLTRFKGQRKNI